MIRSSWTTPLAVLLAAGLALGCGGPQVPNHDGYRSPKSKPWKKPKLIKFDDSQEAEAEGSLSYPKRRRARWYAVETPADGELTVKMDVTPIGDRQEVKLGFEVLDANYKVLMRLEARDDERRAEKSKKKVDKTDADDEYDDDDYYDEEEDDDADDDSDSDAELLEWSRTLYELAAGRYYLHIYLNSRLDVADYSMRLKFAGASIDQQSDFPAQVGFLNPLPVVPALDDAPEVDCKACSCSRDKRCKSDCGKCHRSTGHRPSRCASCDCQGPCKSKCTKKCGSSEPAATAIMARITRPVAAGGGTRITMNRGSSNGVQVGWKGAVVSKSGKPIDNGRFTVEKVTSGECVGTVGASPDAVTAAGRVRLTPP